MWGLSALPNSCPLGTTNNCVPDTVHCAPNQSPDSSPDRTSNVESVSVSNFWTDVESDCVTVFVISNKFANAVSDRKPHSCTNPQPNLRTYRQPINSVTITCSDEFTNFRPYKCTNNNLPNGCSDSIMLSHSGAVCGCCSVYFLHIRRLHGRICWVFGHTLPTSL